MDLTSQFGQAANAAAPAANRGQKIPFEGEALHAQNLLTRMDAAAASASASTSASTGRSSSTGAFGQLEFDTMLASSVHYKKQQTQLTQMTSQQNQISTEVKSVKADTAGIRSDIRELVQNVRATPPSQHHNLRQRLSPATPPRDPSGPASNEDEVTVSSDLHLGPLEPPDSLLGTQRYADQHETDETARHEADRVARLEDARNEAARLEAARPETPPPPGPAPDVPDPLKNAADKVTGWSANLEVHKKFALFCRCTGNAKLKDTDRLFDREETITFTRYFDSLGKCKSIRQWRDRLEATNFPPASVAATRSIQDVGRLLVLQFIAHTQPGDPFGAELTNREHFLDEGYCTWLRSQA